MLMKFTQTKVMSLQLTSRKLQILIHEADFLKMCGALLGLQRQARVLIRP